MSFDVETLGAILACSGGYSGNLSASKIVNTVSGSPAVIEDASNLPLERIDFYGETKLVPNLGDVTIPSPDHPLLIERTVINQVEVIGKNLLDTRGLKTVSSSGITFTPVYEDNELQYINVDGVWDDSSSYNNVRMKLGTWYPKDTGNYILSGMTYLGSTSFIGLDKNGNLGEYEKQATTSKEFTVDEDAEYYDVWLRIAAGTTVNNLKVYPMIRHAEIADPTYEPFQCQTVDLPDPITLNGINGIKDSTKLNRFETVVFDGTENWTWYKEQYLNLFMLADIRPYGNGLNSVLCTHFPYDSGDLLQGRNECRLRVASPTGTFYISSIKHSSVSAFKAWLAEQYANGTPVTLIYEVSEPTETTMSQANINAIKSAHTYKPNTVVTNNANALMDVHYVADRKSYIDKKFEALANAVLNQ